jgi:hypothetical protein
MDKSEGDSAGGGKTGDHGASGGGSSRSSKDQGHHHLSHLPHAASGSATTPNLLDAASLFGKLAFVKLHLFVIIILLSLYIMSRSSISKI